MSAFESIRILYIEDDATIAHPFRKKLERAGYIVDVADDGEKGLAMSRGTAYDIVAVDQATSAHSGLEVIRSLTTLDPLPPTIVIVPPGNEKIAVEAIKLGASDYIIKDTAGDYLELLTAVIEQVLHRQRLVEEKQRAQEEAKKNLFQIERAKQEWETTVDSLSQLVCLLDQHGRIIRANRVVERWDLARVADVKGQNLHQLLHPNCDDPICYMKTHWPRAWTTVSQQEQPAEFEIRDRVLKRYFHVQVQPISTETNWRNKVAPSFAVVIVHDITARKQAEEALRRHARELRERNEELDAFAHTVAHDLQNPVGLIIGLADVLDKYYAVITQEEIREYLHNIGETARKMSNIIEELLLLASVRQQEVELEPLDMASLVTEAQRRLVDLIEKHQAEIILPTEEWPVALGYAPWIEEVWVNYVSNAIKHGGRPPRLELGAIVQEDGMVRFWVSDNGLGIIPEDQAQIFTPFVRLNQVQTKGHGLGLSIVQRIVEKLGGQVGVESDGIPGRGSVFTFTLSGAAD